MKINMKNLKKSKLLNYVIKYHISHINYQLYFERISPIPLVLTTTIDQ